FTPGTSGLPSKSLRIATAASSALASPSLHARAHRSALRLAVAEMQPAKIPRRASRRAASVEGNTTKFLEIAAPERAEAVSPEESLSPTMRDEKESRSRRISGTCQGRPDIAGK